VLLWGPFSSNLGAAPALRRRERKCKFLGIMACRVCLLIFFENIGRLLDNSLLYRFLELCPVVEALFAELGVEDVDEVVGLVIELALV